MSRRPEIWREIKGQPERVSCGHVVPVGSRKWQTARGKPWTCPDCRGGQVRDFRPRRGRVTVAEVLEAERRAGP